MTAENSPREEGGLGYETDKGETPGQGRSCTATWQVDFHMLGMATGFAYAVKHSDASVHGIQL